MAFDFQRSLSYKNFTYLGASYIYLFEKIFNKPWRRFYSAGRANLGRITSGQLPHLSAAVGLGVWFVVWQSVVKADGKLQ